ncbi:kit ligand b isoform X2 [Clupea harengus]|uniref:Kit ligand b isoform X2 n=1 Tax=Clupea harengus TaxID=7950 RepID=A0A8M1KK31_CLUHA|nr:kit ligand b isoform X2 [Clupea harengus]
MKKTNIGESVCILALLLSTLVTGGVKGRTPLTDDVGTLDVLKGNIPRDYRILVNHTPKAVAGKCWLQLNIYPVEKSLKQLAHKFNNLSINRENITIFITMLQGLRFMLGNEELDLAMQAFECHFRTAHWPTELYFDHVKEVFSAAANVSGILECAPPPCPSTLPPSATTGHERQYHIGESLKRSLPVLLLVPVLFLLFLGAWMVVQRRRVCMNNSSRGEARSPQSEAALRGPEPQHRAAQEGPLELSPMTQGRRRESAVVMEMLEVMEDSAV